ncbi:MAG TPA: hypothetical protein VK010_02460 [Flavobacteriaceae bacterium]|nr:hypothetical protein [Flavobacteriaceae bacterium]
MKIKCITMLILGSLLFITHPISAQEKDPWDETQLMEPESLAEILNDSEEKNDPLILAVNPDGMYGLPYEGGIKNSIWFGPAGKEENLAALKKFLEQPDKDAEIVIYCGCCPTEMCPNIRPAFELLNELGFENHKLLNIPTNIEKDWMEKGFPMKK